MARWHKLDRPRSTNRRRCCGRLCHPTALFTARAAPFARKEFWPRRSRKASKREYHARQSMPRARQQAGSRGRDGCAAKRRQKSAKSARLINCGVCQTSGGAGTLKEETSKDCATFHDDAGTEILPRGTAASPERSRDPAHGTVRDMSLQTKAAKAHGPQHTPSHCAVSCTYKARYTHLDLRRNVLPQITKVLRRLCQICRETLTPLPKLLQTHNKLA